MQNNFYEWANKWFTQIGIPEDRHEWGTFSILQEKCLNDQLALLNNLSCGDNLAHIWNAIINNYSAIEDNSAIANKLAQIDYIFSSFSIKRLSYYMYYAKKNNINNVINIDVTTDLYDSGMQHLTFIPAGLSLPNRDYYLLDKYSEQLKFFKNHLENIKNIFLIADANFANNIIEFETLIARITIPSDMARQHEKLYKKTTVMNFLDKNFVTYFGDVPLIVYDINYFNNLFKILFNKNNFHKFKSYCKYNVIKTLHLFVPNNAVLRDEFFDFYLARLNGQKKQQPEEKQALHLINNLVGELVGKLYVETHFSIHDKNDVENMVHNILNVMRTSLHNNTVLAEKTKQNALIKLNKFKIKIGYPSKWTNYDQLYINSNDTLFTIREKITSFEYKTNFLDKINTTVDKDKWHMTPQSVNAYFSPNSNEIVFPAAILQPPFYYPKTYDFFKYNLDIRIPLNYGGIGTVIAHEIIHGYDDQGSKYNGDGNLENWWTAEDHIHYKSKMKLLEEQVSKYEFHHKNKIYKMNAGLTMGENLADIGGLTLGIRCIDNNVISHYVFFRAWANVWKCNRTDEKIINMLSSNPHAPSSFRGNLVSNLDEFYDVFDIGENDGMYIAPEKRVRIW